MIFVSTGDGGGKTTGAIGLSLRALGNGRRVVIVQFMKGRFTGELEALKRFPDCDFKQFGRTDFVDLKEPLRVDKELARRGLEYAFDSLSTKPFLLVLDEINLASAIGLIPVSDVVSLVKSAKCHVVLTGRRALKELVDVADFVTEYTDLKRKDKKAEAGIEF